MKKIMTGLLVTLILVSCTQSRDVRFRAKPILKGDTQWITYDQVVIVTVDSALRAGDTVLLEDNIRLYHILTERVK